MQKQHDPMLVMEYMEYGSLVSILRSIIQCRSGLISHSQPQYNVLHNESVLINGDRILPILQDIAQGMRFLHTAYPLIVHGDLKAENVLLTPRTDRWGHSKSTAKVPQTFHWADSLGPARCAKGGG